MKYVGLTALMLILVTVHVGCSRSNGANEPNGEERVPAISAEPVTITAAIEGISVDARFQQLILDQLKIKHPNITFQIYQPGKGTTLD